MSEEAVLRVLNYRSTGKIAFTADEIPNIAPKEAVAEFMKGDEAPYFKLQRIDYPIKANGLNYSEKFFETYLKNVSLHPFPGSKDGHALFGNRGKTDFVLIGGLIEKKENGKGSVYLKNYIPPVGESGSNETFIKECKSGMIHFSIVSHAKHEMIETPNGKEINIVESLYGERNDAVDHGTGAMKQVTNAAVGGDNETEKTERKSMPTKKEIMDMLADKSGEKVTLQEIATVMNCADQLLTKEHVDALAVVNSLKELGVADPISELKMSKETTEVAAKAIRNARLDKEFGVQDKDNKNLLRAYADEMVSNAKEDNIEKQIEAIKKSPIAVRLAEKQTDIVHNVGVVEGLPTGTPAPDKTGRRVDEV